MKRWGSQGYIWGKFYSMPFLGEWTVVCFFKSFTQFLGQFIFGWSSSRVHPTTTGAPDGLVESSLWGCGGVMSCGWLDVSRAAQWCDDELSFFYVSYDQWSRQTWTNTSMIWTTCRSLALFLRIRSNRWPTNPMISLGSQIHWSSSWGRFNPRCFFLHLSGRVAQLWCTDAGT